ncbi:MAG TPA: hypothetical protein VHR66_31430 [Gemmataceae bacterium]|jgi:hypothetical protein|nr:hypothetical protein [Gemmataceae bacterium]
MIRPQLENWGQDLDDLRRLATEAPHRRTRERFLALLMVATGQYNATTWAAQTERNDETILGWIHTDNEHGPERLSDRRTGGSAPFLHRNKSRRSPRQ